MKLGVIYLFKLGKSKGIVKNPNNVKNLFDNSELNANSSPSTSCNDNTLVRRICNLS